MLCFADIAVGDLLPTLSKGPVTRQMLVEWCAAENDYYPLHFDERVASAMNLPGTPVQGTYKYALMGQLIGRWAGSNGILERITASYRGLDLEGETLAVRGRVVGCQPLAQGGRVELEVWVENGAGQSSTSGHASILFI